MVKEIKYKGQKVYVCEVCDFKYKERKWAKKCEDWEKVNKSCNVLVIKHAIK